MSFYFFPHQIIQLLNLNYGNIRHNIKKQNAHSYTEKETTKHMQMWK